MLIQASSRDNSMYNPTLAVTIGCHHTCSHIVDQRKGYSKKETEKDTEERNNGKKGATYIIQK